MGPQNDGEKGVFAVAKKMNYYSGGFRGGVRGVQMHPPLAASSVFLCT